MRQSMELRPRMDGRDTAWQGGINVKSKLLTTTAPDPSKSSPPASEFEAGFQPTPPTQGVMLRILEMPMTPTLDEYYNVQNLHEDTTNPRLQIVVEAKKQYFDNKLALRRHKMKSHMISTQAANKFSNCAKSTAR